MSMRTIENTPYDYTRLRLFEINAKLTFTQRDEIELIFRELLEHIFSQIDTMFEIAIVKGLERQQKDYHATN